MEEAERRFLARGCFQPNFSVKSVRSRPERLLKSGWVVKMVNLNLPTDWPTAPPLYRSITPPLCYSATPPLHYSANLSLSTDSFAGKLRTP